MILDYAVRHLKSKKIPIIQIKGEIDIHTAKDFKKILDEIISLEKEQNIIIIDLEKVNYIDSTGLGTIASSLNQLQQNNGELFLISTNPTIQKILNYSGLTKKNLKVFENEQAIEEAINA